MPRIKFGYASMKFMHNEDGSYLLEMLKTEEIAVVKAGIKAFEEFVKKAKGMADEKPQTQVMFHEGEEV